MGELSPINLKTASFQFLSEWAFVFLGRRGPFKAFFSLLSGSLWDKLSGHGWLLALLPQTLFQLSPLWRSEINKWTGLSLNSLPACLKGNAGSWHPDPWWWSRERELFGFRLRSVEYPSEHQSHGLIKHLPHHRMKWNSCDPWKGRYSHDDGEKTEDP